MEFVDYLKRPDKYKVNSVAHSFCIIKMFHKAYDQVETLFIFYFQHLYFPFGYYKPSYLERSDQYRFKIVKCLMKKEKGIFL